ncbi:ATP-NAD kinase-like domain-containing protein [Suillus discolor]|uniref:ATP-NAD kinase-like domain-containing protein n=1 Tax=Suillus discolor TaxID=1912936 RepID=A0A9P7F7B3_9AGAM|nr:ATP-NAD kinase-like domain-containing protein [Suillus discolor]KAG2109308.1 ATP-NAD kinase-like domain-containing protein [Suillus discolor]
MASHAQRAFLFFPFRRCLHTRRRNRPSLPLTSRANPFIPQLPHSRLSRALSQAINETSYPPRSILIVNKLRTEPVIGAIDELLDHVAKTYPGVKVFSEDRPDIPFGAQVWRPGPHAEKIDLVVTLGGDGTILHAASLFSLAAVPPDTTKHAIDIDGFVKGLEAVFQGKATILNRMRLSCMFYDKDRKKIGFGDDEWQVTNEIALHRGSSPHLNTIDICVDGQHLPSTSDGVIVSTPTGSTAYSLSAGGPIVCPRSLSFRPLVFPSSSSLTLRISDRPRAAAGVSMDGRVSHILNPGESVIIQASLYSVPCINRSSISDYGDEQPGEEGVGPGKEDDWVRDINNVL